MLLLHMGPHSNAQLDSSGVGLNGTAMLAVGGAAECNMLQPHAEHAWRQHGKHNKTPSKELHSIICTNYHWNIAVVSASCCVCVIRRHAQICSSAHCDGLLKWQGCVHCMQSCQYQTPWDRYASAFDFKKTYLAQRKGGGAGVSNCCGCHMPTVLLCWGCGDCCFAPER